MAHENSETVKIGKRWFNRATTGTAKRILGPKGGFSTRQEAVSAAKQRSQNFKLPKRKPKRTK